MSQTRNDNFRPIAPRAQAPSQARGLFQGIGDEQRRRDLIRDCEAAGYSQRDAVATADRIINTMPGLAAAPCGAVKALSRPNNINHSPTVRAAPAGQLLGANRQ